MKDKNAANAIFGLLTVVKGLMLVVFLFFGHIVALFSGASADEVSKLIGVVNAGDSIEGIAVNCFLYLSYALVPLLFYFAFRNKAVAADAVMAKRPTLMQVGATLGFTSVFAGVVSFAVEILLAGLFEFFGKDYPVDTATAPTNAWLFPLFLIFSCVLPAFCEEFLCRGAVFGRFRKFGVGFAVVLSSICFMMLHNTIYQLPYAFACGLAICYCMFKFQSVWVGVLAHFFINLNACIVQAIRNPEILDRYFVIIFFLNISLAVAGVVLYGLRLPAREKVTPELRRERRKMLLKSPFFYTFLLLFFIGVYFSVTY